MKVTINELLEQNNLKLEDSVYQLIDDGVRDFIITSGNFFEIQNAKKWNENSWFWNLFNLRLMQKKDGSVYKVLEQHHEELKQEIQKIKEKDPNGYEHISELRALREAKKGIMQSIHDLEKWYEKEIEDELKKEYNVKKRELLIYKNTVSMGSFLDLQKQMEPFSKISLPWILKEPLFFGNMKSLKLSLEKKIPIGIVGGPCLFGTYEVEVLIYHKDGTVYTYDFNTGRNYDNTGKMEFADHVENYVEKIEQIHFRNQKSGITIQEYESLEILFLFAEVLNGKVVIPIPDMSYQKYLNTVLEPLDDMVREKVFEEFRTETRKITDMYLNVIELLKHQHSTIEVCVFHERANEICKLFHEKRELYFKNSKTIRKMTRKRKKTDAIFDYISMLALPFYLWGTPQVLQVDNLDEADSFRKCKRIHKDAFALSSILYPERLSKNNEDTIFNAPLDYKEYL